MAVGIMENIKNNAAARQARQPANTERAVAQTWVNIGYETADGKFVNLPLGTALDTMEPSKIRGTDPDFVALQHAQNDLLKALQKIGDDLEPGAAEFVNLKIQVRKVKDQVEIKPEENSYSMANSGINLRSA